MSTTFAEKLLNPDYSAIRAGGPEFSTAIISTPAGLSQRNINRFDAVRRWQIDFSLLHQPVLRDLRAAHLGLRGQAYGFRFKDWSEFWFSDDGTPDSPIATPHQFGTGNGTATAFQLKKTYTFATGFSYEQTIVKPVASVPGDSRGNTISIYKNGVLQTLTTDYTIDYQTGIVTFTSAPTNGHALTVTGEFDFPATFGSDWFNPQIGDAITAASHSFEIVELLPSELGL